MDNSQPLIEERRIAQQACRIGSERRLRAFIYEAMLDDQETEIPGEALPRAAPPPSSFAP